MQQKIAVLGATGRVGRHIVDVLTERGHKVVPMSRASGVDVTTGAGLASALRGVGCVIDAATGPIPVNIVRAAQFHEFVEQLVRWGTQGEIAYVPRMCTQLVAARTVAESLADLATAEDPVDALVEVAGPRPENLGDMARLLVARRGEHLKVDDVLDLADPDRDLVANGALLPGPDAILAGPTFEQWLDTQV